MKPKYKIKSISDMYNENNIKCFDVQFESDSGSIVKWQFYGENIYNAFNTYGIGYEMSVTDKTV